MSDRGTEKREILRVTDLSKSYYHLGREVPILNRANLVLYEGDMLSVSGKSGIGKSTFLHVVGTLDRPTAGSVHYWGEDVFSMSDGVLARFRNEQLGFIFQFHHLLPEFTALENVMIPALIARRDSRSARERAEGLLEEVGLSHRREHRPGELSGGEQQRVAIARALMMKPRIVFADEPTGNLDERTSDEIHELLFRLNEDLNLTLVVVTHSASLAKRLPSRYVMRDGTLEKSDG